MTAEPDRNLQKMKHLLEEQAANMSHLETAAKGHQAQADLLGFEMKRSIEKLAGSLSETIDDRGTRAKSTSEQQRPDVFDVLAGLQHARSDRRYGFNLGIPSSSVVLTGDEGVVNTFSVWEVTKPNSGTGQTGRMLSKAASNHEAHPKLFTENLLASVRRAAEQEDPTPSAVVVINNAEQQKLWTKLVEQMGEHTGGEMELKPAQRFTTFEIRLLQYPQPDGKVVQFYVATNRDLLQAPQAA